MYYFSINQIKSTCVRTSAINFDINYYVAIPRDSGVYTHFSLINFVDLCSYYDAVIYDEIASFPKHQRTLFHTFWSASDLMATTIHRLILNPLRSTEFQVT